MKKIVVIMAVLFLFACSSKQTMPDYNKLTRLNFHYTSEKVKMINDVEPLKGVFSEIKWQEGMPKMARKPDVTAVLFIMNDETKTERLYTYEILYNDGGTATVIDEENSLIGSLAKNPTIQLKSAFSCENGCTDAP
ncbi:hypothetical protein [Solibacillus sp. CAU 1738]|uniref:hypothetical protein n=1 Tax=Solibacillus sp. CAU 1738 TaxID=3140363 RepID=UPI00326046E5